MLLRRTAAATVLCRHFSSNTKPFSKIPWKHRSKAIQESQIALSDYFHATRSLPFVFADSIAKNSIESLSKVVSKIPFSPENFSASFQRFLRYNPLNEIDFFFESIGLNSSEKENPRFSFPTNTIFLSDLKHFEVACALAGLGFPWSKLGLLCVDEFSIFESDPLDLTRKYSEIKGEYRFNSDTVISICLAFPWVLYNNEMDGLLSDLKILFLDYGLWSLVEGDNADSMLVVCEKIKCFYDLGCEMGKIGELMGRSKTIFIEHSKEDLISKIDFFCKLNALKDEIGVFLLSRPEIFGFDLETRVISVSGFLNNLGLSEGELESLYQEYPHVFGRNKVANLSNIMRSMNLEEWFFEKLKNGYHSLLSTYTIHCDEDLDKHYAENLKKILSKRTRQYAIKKVNFLHGIGFGENMYSIKALALLNSSDRQLQKRFDCLLNCGVQYSKLCAIVKVKPKILNQQESSLEKKIEYLCSGMGSSIKYLEVFPGYLCYDLERRIKPRYKFHRWLVDMGLCRKEYSITTIIASSEKAYVKCLSLVSRDVVRMWEEGRADRARELPRVPCLRVNFRQSSQAGHARKFCSRNIIKLHM